MEKDSPRSSFKFGVGSVLGRSISIWLRNIIPFTLLMFLAHVPLIIYSYVFLAVDPSEEPHTFSEHQIFNLVKEYGPRILALLADGALIYGVLEQMSGKRPRMGECIRVGATRLGPVLGVGLLTGLLWNLPMIIADRIHPGVILIAAIPSLVLMCVFFVAVPVAVVERPGLIGAIRRSAYLTKNYKRSIFGVLLLLGLMQGVVVIVFSQFVLVDASPQVSTAALLGLAILFGGLTATMSAVVYHDLRLTKEGVRVDELKEVFA